MMHPIIRFILCLAVMTLVACANQASLTPATNAKALCKNTCQQRFKTCSQVCHNTCRECNQASARRTSYTYDNYKHQQCVQGGIIARELNSFRDPLQCRKITCDCFADYNVCTQSCDGIIHKRLQVAPCCA